jgi:hypothetical protein
MTDDGKTIADAVIMYRKQLLAADFPVELANDITRDAASRVVQSQGADALKRLVQ